MVQSLRSGFREMKISPAILINRRYTAIDDFCLPNVNKGSQTDPADMATTTTSSPHHGDSRGVQGNARNKGNKKTGLAPDS